MSKKNAALFWLFALVVGITYQAPIASAVNTAYKSAIIFGATAGTWSGATGGAATADHGVYWNSGDGLPHVRLSNGTEYAIPQSSVAAGGGYATLANSTTPLTQRATVNFTGSGISCADNSGSSRTDCTVKDPAVFNVRDYGAIGNGIANDTTAIQATITAAGTAGTVYLPAGTYKISSPLLISGFDGLRFVGAGMYATKITWAGGTNSYMLDIRGTQHSYFGQFTLIGDGGSTMTGIRFNGSNTVHSQKDVFEDIYFYSGMSYCIRIGDLVTSFPADQATYRNCVIDSATVAAVYISDQNAVFHDFYDCQFQFNADGIVSYPGGGHFNVYGCGFGANTGTDIKTYAGSRGYVIANSWAESGNVFLQMPVGSTNSTVTLLETSVNGSTSVAGPHIVASAGSLNIIGGKYTASPNTFVIGVSGSQGQSVNINTQGTIFRDGNPFTGAGIALASINQIGVKYSNIGGDTSSFIGPAVSATDTAGNNLVFTAGKAGVVSTAAGKAAGDAKLIGAPGAAGTAGFAAGPGGSVYILGNAAGANGGAGGANGGNVYIGAGALTGAGAGGTIQFLDTAGAQQAVMNPGGTTFLFPTTTNAKTIGGTSNYFSNGFLARQTALGQVIAAAATITINPASGSKVRINLSATAITAITYTAGNDGERTTVCVAEDATGTRTIPTTWTNVRFVGTYTATTTPSKIDCINFIYDSTAAAYLETSRAMSL